MSRSLLSAAVASLAALVVLGAPLPCVAEPPLEYQVQAAYVSRFLRFVEWPDHRGGTFIVGVVGDSDFREAMDVLDGYAIGNHTVESGR